MRNPETIERITFSTRWIVGGELFPFYTDLSQYIVDNEEKLTIVKNQKLKSVDGIMDLLRGTREGVHEIKNTDALSAFTGAWNSLVGQTTTKPEDLDTILAIRLGFRPATLSEIRPRAWRMKSILKSYDRLPVALLYSTGKKLQGATPHDSWIPLNSGLIFSFAGSVLVSRREQRPLLPKPSLSKPEQSLN
jgi:hypothetical protein